MSWFTSKSGKTEELLNRLISVQKEEILCLRVLHDRDRQRIDRLTESLARKAGVDLIMPPPELPPQPPTVPLPNPWKDPNPVTLIKETVR